MSLSVSLGDTTIESGRLCAIFVAFFFGPPLSNNSLMQWALQEYCHTLFTKTDASIEVVILSLIYAQRYLSAAAASTTVAPSSLSLPQGVTSEYLLMTVSCRLAFKWHDDRHMWWMEVNWEDASGIHGDTIDQCEWHFVETIGYQLFVSEEEYSSFMTLLKLLVAPTPPPTPQAALALPSSSSSSPPLVEVKPEPMTPLPAIKCETLSPHSLPYIPVKVEDLGDDSALLASLVAQGEDHGRSVSLPVTTNITDTIMRYSV